jgi:hypothetical protein
LAQGHVGDTFNLWFYDSKAHPEMFGDDSDKPASVGPLVRVNEVLGEDVSSHARGIAVPKVNLLLMDLLIQPRDADLMRPTNVAQRRRLTSQEDPPSSLIVLKHLQRHGRGLRPLEDRFPQIQPGQSFGSDAVVACHEFGLDGAMAHRCLLFGLRSQRVERVSSVQSQKHT